MGHDLSVEQNDMYMEQYIKRITSTIVAQWITSAQS